MKSTKHVYPVGLLITFLIGLHSVSNGQYDFKKSAVLLKNGGIKSGWINLEKWTINPEKVTFSIDSTTGGIIEYTPDDIRAFEIFGYESYLSVNFHIINPSDSVVNKSKLVFMRYLVKGGKIDLLKYNSKDYSFYVLQDSNGKMVSFDNRTYIDELYLSAKQIGYDSIGVQLDNLSYTEKNLIGFVKSLNNFDRKSDVIFTIAENKYKHFYHFHMGVVAGFTHSSPRWSDYSIRAFQSVAKPVYGLIGGVDFIVRKDRLIVRIESSFCRSSYELQGSGQRFEATLYSLNNEVSLLCYLFHQTFSPYIGLGFGHHITFYSQNGYLGWEYDPKHVQKEFLPLGWNWGTVHCTAGIKINSQWDASINGHFLGNWSWNQIGATYYTLNMIYHFKYQWSQGY